MRKYFLLIIALFCCAISIAQNKKAVATNEATFDSYIKTAMQLWKTPGLSVVVVKDGIIVFKKGYGVTNITKGDPFTTSTVSICASTTKAMTAVCMGMLVDEGKVRWTDKVSDVYPALKLYDNYANSEMTVKDLFTHNTGLGNADWLWTLGYPLDTIVNKMRLLKPAYSFRSSFIYQNLMYMIAGEVIHKVSCKTWDEFIKERLFTPLGMMHTYPNYDASANEPSHITPHFIFDDTIVRPIRLIDYSGIDAAGGVWSCADDINKWLLFLLDSAKVNGTPLLKPETYAMLFTPQTVLNLADEYPATTHVKHHWGTYALGWFQEDYRGKMLNFHTGSLDGAVAICGLVNDEHFGIYIFGNLDHTELRHALLYKAADLWVFNDSKTDWSTDFYKLYKGLRDTAEKQTKDFEAKRVLNTKPSLALKEYAGKYSNEIYGGAEIVYDNDSLLLKFPNSVDVKLSHWHYDTFLGKFEYEWMDKDWLTFTLDSSGKVASFNFLGMEYDKE